MLWSKQNPRSTKQNQKSVNLGNKIMHTEKMYTCSFIPDVIADGHNDILISSLSPEKAKWIFRTTGQNAGKYMNPSLEKNKLEN